MADMFRFPIPSNTDNLVAERSQIITLATIAAPSVNAFPAGGFTPYGDITPWHLAYYNSETPYCDIVIEFTAGAAVTIGDGSAAQMLGLFGGLNDDGTGNPHNYFLGVLGVQLAATKPQIPILSSTVGYAQIIQHVPIYDTLSVGGINGDVPLVGNSAVTIKVRPVRHRSFVG